MSSEGFIRDSVWGVPLVGVPSILFETHATLPAKVIASIACIVLTAAVAAVGQRALRASRARQGAGPGRQRLIAAVVLTVDVTLTVALLVPLWVASR
jgi:hypothetical protein